MIESQQVLEWMAQGEAKGRVEGEARGGANSLLQLLEKRHGPVPADLLKAIRQTKVLSRLRIWFDLAIDAPSVTNFRNLAGI